MKKRYKNEKGAKEGKKWRLKERNEWSSTSLDISDSDFEISQLGILINDLAKLILHRSNWQMTEKQIDNKRGRKKVGVIIISHTI